MEEYIDYQTLNMAFDVFYEGRVVTIHAPAPRKSTLKPLEFILGLYFSDIQKYEIAGMIVNRDWESHLENTLRKQGLLDIKEDDPALESKLQIYIEKNMKSIKEFFDYVLSLSYVIDGGNVENLTHSNVYKNNNIVETIKGCLLVFIASARYLSGVFGTEKMNSIGCVYTSLNATEYSNSLTTPPQPNPETSKM